MQQAAERYAAMGWSVFPVHTVEQGRCSCGDAGCERQGKHPRISNGFKGATTDVAVLRDWWGRWPNANIGLATGPASGAWVLDIDGPEAEAVLAELEERYGALPPTAAARTGKGRHMFFDHKPLGDRVVKSKVKHDGKPIDVRGQGGYVVLAPSRHLSGRCYEWTTDPDTCPPATAPAWLHDYLSGPAPPRR